MSLYDLLSIPVNCQNTVCSTRWFRSLDFISKGVRSLLSVQAHGVGLPTNVQTQCTVKSQLKTRKLQISDSY